MRGCFGWNKFADKFVGCALFVPKVEVMFFLRGSGSKVGRKIA
jgi:hypothetical protein